MTLINYPMPEDLPTWLSWYELLSTGHLETQVLHSTRILASKHEKKKFAGTKNKKHKR